MRRRPPPPKRTVNQTRQEYDRVNLMAARIWLAKAAELGEEAAVIRVSRATLARIEKERNDGS